MRTAEEILKDYLPASYPRLDHIYPTTYKAILTAINEARREAIEECAHRAEVKMEYGRDNFIPTTAYVDRKSIFEITKELK